jgi:diacylglycerol kinase family enzyme/membrane-associated phospholipid phosphatase
MAGRERKRGAARLEPLQRRVRRLVPAPVRRADLTLFRRVASARIPVLGPPLPRLSRAANRSGLWLAIAAGLAAVGGRRGRRAAWRGVLAIAATSASTNLPAKLLTGRERPDLSVVPEVRHLARVPTSTSFPSGHAASAFAFATAVGIELPRLRLPLFGLAGAVAFSRVYTGVHYPGDVLAGAATGSGIALATTGPWPVPDPTPASGATVDPDLLADPDGAGIVLVANADAGNALGSGPEGELREALPGIRILQAESGEELPALLARGVREARVLGVAGGDGSAGFAAAVAHDAGVPLLVVPAGTLNHLAADLGVDEVDATVRAVRQRRAIRMDLGEIDGRVFVNVASIGAYAQLVAHREGLQDRIGKWPAALWCTFRLLVRGRPTEVEVDGRPRRVWLLAFGNGWFRADGLLPRRRDRLDDGMLDVRLIDAEVPFSRARTLLSILVGRAGRSRAYERWGAREVEVRSAEGPLRMAGDGETWVGSDRFVVRKRPSALVVLQPEPDAPEPGASTHHRGSGQEAAATTAGLRRR